MIPGSKMTAPEPATQAAGPPRGSHTGLAIVLFFMGALVFSGTMLLLGAWLRGPAGSGSNDSDLPPALASGAPGGAGDGPIQAARAAARRDEFRIFFTSDGLKLDPQIRRSEGRTISEPHQRLRFVLHELLLGPPGDALHSPVPANTDLRGAFILKDTAVVDLSGEIVKHPQGGPMAELLCAYAIVNTVVENVEGIAEVRILIDGESVPVLWDQVDLSGPLAEDVSLVR
jgi:hypothetical protein